MTDDRWNELLELTDRLLEGALSHEEAERLAVWLSIDDEAQSVYLRSLQLHADLTLTFNEFCGVNSPSGDPLQGPSSGGFEDAIAKAVSMTVPSEPCTVSAEGAGWAKFCNRMLRLSRNSVLACLAVMLAVVAVFGSERLIFEVLGPRRSATVDRAGGLLYSVGEKQKDAFYQGPNQSRGTRRVGSGRPSGVALANVFLFSLPHLEDLERIASARIEWTYKTKDNEPTFSVDLYGLGYIQSGSMERLDFWEGPIDASLRSAYGMEGSPSRRVALIERGAMTPQTPCGRVVVESRDLVAFLQSLYEDGARAGDIAVFRLNADSSTAQISRETGYAVVHPPTCAGMTSDEELPTLTLRARSGTPEDDQLVAEAVMTAHSVSEHWSGGLVQSFHNRVQPGCNADGTRRVGSSSFDGVGLANVFVFSLPPVEKLRGIVSARVEWTLVAKNNDPDFSVDLYGLGYYRGESYHGPCFFEGAQDAATPEEYALKSGPDGQVALVARRVMNPESSCGRIVVENEALIQFLQSLYEGGAREGDLAVFRLNADVSTVNISRTTGYAVVHTPELAEITRSSDLPVLLMTYD